MSPRVAWALILLSEGVAVDWIEPRESYRLRRALDRLAADDQPELLLRSWVASRAVRRQLSAPEVVRLQSDPRVVLSGVSDQRSGMSSPGGLEGYVLAEEADAVFHDHLLIDAGPSSDVVLHCAPMTPEAPVPLLLVAADLAEHDGPRELARARELIGNSLASRREAGT